MFREKVPKFPQDHFQDRHFLMDSKCDISSEVRNQYRTLLQKKGATDQLLITLEYWREYRTYFHLGNSWGVNESTA